MKRYFDTGVLVKAYAVEPGTAQALVLIRQVKPPIPFTHLHGIEIRSALPRFRFHAPVPLSCGTY
ncbi:MAG: hypothetical protein WAK31_28280 [Chthoniobacterales bacterium]